MPTARLFNALLSAFGHDTLGDPKNDQQARALTEFLTAFESLLAPPAPAAEGIELIADDTQALILAELQKHTELLTNLCRYQDDEVTRQRRHGAALAPSLRTAVSMPALPPGPEHEYDPTTGTVRLSRTGGPEGEQ